MAFLTLYLSLLCLGNDNNTLLSSHAKLFRRHEFDENISIDCMTVHSYGNKRAKYTMKYSRYHDYYAISSDSEKYENDMYNTPDYVYCRGNRYFFQLDRNKSEKYIVSDFKVPSPELLKSYQLIPESFRRYVQDRFNNKKAVFTKLSWFSTVYIDALPDLSNIKIINCIVQQGKLFVDAEYEMLDVFNNNKEYTSKLSVIYDIEKNYLPTSFNQEHGDDRYHYKLVTTGSRSEENKNDYTDTFKCRRQFEKSGKKVYDEKLDYSVHYQFNNNNESMYTLSHYGLDELNPAPTPVGNVPYFIYISIAGVVLLLIAIVIQSRMMRSRRLRS